MSAHPTRLYRAGVLQDMGEQETREQVCMISKPKKIKAKSTSALKGECNKAFSKYIRERDGYVCQFHSKLRERGIKHSCQCNITQSSQACHKISRKKASILYDDRNVFCGCSASNTWSHWNEPAWDRLWRLLWPEDEAYLDQKSKMICKRTRKDYQNLTAFYKSKVVQ